jgi:hypothetical protein
MQFSWNGWNYYQTKTGKLKKFQNGKKNEPCSDDEWKKVTEAWAKVFRN